MLRKVPFVEGEIYHLYNRGAHKNSIFTEDSDYRRFQLLLYVANSTEPVHFGNLLDKYKGRSFLEMFSEPVTNPLVSVFGYCLMPNHYHLVLEQIAEDGIPAFMRKIGTGYSMYFNTKYEHGGVVFQGRYQSKHIDNDAYLRHIFSYVHLNPLELVAPNWKEKGVADEKRAREFINGYRYSSHADYLGTSRPEGSILGKGETPAAIQGVNEFENLMSWIKDPGASLGY